MARPIKLPSCDPPIKKNDILPSKPIQASSKTPVGVVEPRVVKVKIPQKSREEETAVDVVPTLPEAEESSLIRKRQHQEDEKSEKSAEKRLKKQEDEPFVVYNYMDNLPTFSNLTNEVKKEKSKKDDTKVIIEPETDGKWMYCKLKGCHFWTRKQVRMDRHKKSHIQGDDKFYQCPECQLKICSLSKLLRHDRKFHTGFKDYECKICEAEVTDIAVHMRVRHLFLIFFVFFLNCFYSGSSDRETVHLPCLQNPVSAQEFIGASLVPTLW